MKKNQMTEYKKRILVLVTGLSPQIVTETIYALAVDNTPKFIPTEVHLITSTEGASRASISLLTPGEGHFHKLCDEYGLTGKIQFNEDSIHVIPDAQGRLMNDIRTPEDNTITADFITEFMRDITADPDTMIHVSIAGGRKTMGFYLGYALSLFGRPQDRMSHVLVSEHFESHPQFFYPPVEPKMLTTRDNKPIRTDQAKVMLAEIPFVSMRRGIPLNVLKGKTSYSNIVEVAKTSLAPPQLTINLANKTIHCGSKLVEMNTLTSAFYIWFAKMRKTQGEHSFMRYQEMDHKELLAIYKQLEGGDSGGNYERVETSLKQGFEGNYFSERKNRVETALSDALLQESSRYSIHRKRVKSQYHFSLILEPSQITLI